MTASQQLLDDRIVDPPGRSLTPDGRTLLRLVLLYVLLTTVPQLVKRLVVGRLLDADALAGAVPNPPVVERIGALIAIALVGLCVAVVGRRVGRIALHPPALLLTLAVLVVGPLFLRQSAGLPWLSVAVNVYFFAAVATLRPSIADLRIFAHIGSAIAISSILFGLVSVAAYRYGTLEDARTKAIIGTGVLAGPYPSSNNLGMGMAMALPFAFLVGRRRLRYFEIVALGAALVLSASRSSIIAVGVATVAVVVLRALRNERERSVCYAFGMTFAGLLCVALPWLTNTPTAFTSRGAIWMASRDLILSQPIKGIGFNAYSGDGPVEQITGSVAPAGHNMLLHYWVVSGFFGMLAIGFLLILVVRGAMSRLSGSLVPAGFAFILAVLSAAEMPLRPEQTVGQCWIALPVVALLAKSTKSTKSTAGRALPNLSG